MVLPATVPPYAHADKLGEVTGAALRPAARFRRETI